MQGSLSKISYIAVTHIFSPINCTIRRNVGRLKDDGSTCVQLAKIAITDQPFRSGWSKLRKETLFAKKKMQRCGKTLFYLFIYFFSTQVETSSLFSSEISARKDYHDVSVLGFCCMHVKYRISRSKHEISAVLSQHRTMC